MVTLYAKSEECCGCAACLNACPKGAIVMGNDPNGFSYPRITKELCVSCELCRQVCPMTRRHLNDREPIRTFVALNRSKEILSSSASGGVFPALASLVIENGGVVFGCAYNAELKPRHIGVHDQNDIRLLQGSKYVQSDIGLVYREAKANLSAGRWVLFTGTPCQVAGLRAFLGRDYPKLITADLICHGVPSALFFQGYVRYLEQRLKGRVVDLKFRDKSKGWGYGCKVIYVRKGVLRERAILPVMSYYYSYFLAGDICRDSCYQCRYACGSRVGDFTMGDYWGVQELHHDIDCRLGVSLLLVNTEKGMELLNRLQKPIDLVESSFEHASVHNTQLLRPIRISHKRTEIFRMWRERGSAAVAKAYYRQNAGVIALTRLKMFIPPSVKSFLKRIAGIYS